MLLIALLLLLVGFVFLIFKSRVNQFLYAKGKEVNGIVVLPDILHFDHMTNDQIHKLQHFADVLVTCLVSVVLLYFLIIRRLDYIVLFGAGVLILNVIFIIYSVSTVLPDSKNGNCILSDTWWSNITNMGSCNNLGISGHLGTAGLALILLCHCHGFSNVWLNLLSVVLYVAAFAVICISRNHYTIDCINTTTLLLVLYAYGLKFV